MEIPVFDCTYEVKVSIKSIIISSAINFLH